MLNLRTPCTGVYVDMRSPSCSQVVRFSWERQIVMLLLDYTIRWNTAFLFSRHANRNGEHRVGTFSPARSVSGVIFNVLDQFNRTPDSIRFFIIFLFFVLYFFFFLFLSHSLLLLLLSLSLSLSLVFARGRNNLFHERNELSYRFDVKRSNARERLFLSTAIIELAKKS